MSAPPLDEALVRGIAPVLAPIYADIVAAMCAAPRATGSAPDSTGGTGWSAHAEAAIAFAGARLQRLRQLAEDAALFNARHASVADDAERQVAILDFAARLGADRARLRKDRRAFDAWFDADAVMERYRRRVGLEERACAFALERAGKLAAEAIAAAEIVPDGALCARGLAPLLAQARAYRGEPRVREAAHRAFLHIAARCGPGLTALWSDIALRDTRRAALDTGEAVWTQCHAFSALLAVSPRSVLPLLEQRLSAVRRGEPATRQSAQIFLRRHMARELAGRLAEHGYLLAPLRDLSSDPDGAVRQAVAQAIARMPTEHAAGFATRLRLDRDPQVRAQLLADPGPLAARIGSEAVLGHVLRLLGRDSDEFVLRTTIDAARLLGDWCLAEAPERLDVTRHALQSALTDLRQRVDKPRIRRWAGEAYEYLWLLGDEEARALAAELMSAAARLKEGERARVPALGPAVVADPDKVGRVMAIVAQRDFGFDLQCGARPVLQRGDRMVRRLWRVLFEARVSATDKRQAFLHTIGREYRGTLAAPSARLAELAPTKVPGEPLFQSEDGNWRPYLPLIDHVLAAIDLGEPVRIFSSEGVTTITPPQGFARRLRAYWRISRDFARIAESRNTAGHDLLKALAAEGVALAYAPHRADHLPRGEGGEAPPLPADESVTRFFSVAGPLALVPIWWNDAVAYFATVFANTLVQLAIFVGAAALWFFGRHIVVGRHAVRVREGIPLRLGGWGTRGKSGTERLKAGLVNALGPALVSKTTGCEAMFLNGEAFGDLTEMFLFRPYDKATIWEQYNLIRIARRLKARVFLWECMGLNPAYVRVLQQDWMRDHIGTLTNTYPDHEDVQGPAGRNIPEVMTEFIPARSICLTTEEEMLPILRQGADKVGTRLRAVTWKEAGLVHQQLLDRFPYAEHPYNIALVAAMGDELGLEHDFSFKEMADRVVADLGVLKTYPASAIYGRRLEYVMGNSANERFGAMGNWTRMGFADHALARDPDIFVTTVVNNRADRVPRSRVFARMLVVDVSADRHFLIGSNIEGLIGFIEEEWDLYAAAQSLEAEAEAPLDVFDRLCRFQRIPLSEAELAGRLTAMFAGIGTPLADGEAEAAIAADGVAALIAARSAAHDAAMLAHWEQIHGWHREYAKLRGAISSGGDARAHDGAMRELLRGVFMSKLAPVRDYYIKGEMIVRLIANQTPPGLYNRIMGMQNIKGTGLDFVYRWQAWEAVAKACDQALDTDPAIATRGLAMLASFQEYGILSEDRVRRTVEALLDRGDLPGGYTPVQVEAIRARLEDQMAEFDASDTAGTPDEAAAAGAAGGGRLAGLRKYLLDLLEQSLDGGDAMTRRRKADRIYEAMIAEQISSPRAVLELKKLTSRQKGGWLAEALAGLRPGAGG